MGGLQLERSVSLPSRVGASKGSSLRHMGLVVQVGTPYFNVCRVSNTEEQELLVSV